MNATETLDTYLVEQFRAFYAELVALKQAIARGDRTVAAGGENADSQDGQIERVANRLSQVLERQALDAKRLGGDYGVALYREAQYVMAALADEIFLNEVHWETRDAWNTQLLEQRFFGTYSAGDEFFRRVQQLLQDRNRVYVGLAVIYLMALALGFQGKYRDQPEQPEIASLKRRLYEFVFRHAPDLSSASRRASPGAYLHTVREGVVQDLPYLRLWLIALGITVVLYLLISWILWRDVTAPLWELLKA